MRLRKFLTYSLASVCVLSTIPFLPSQAITMEQIATDANRIREQVKAMRIQAEEDWQTAKTQFEKELLGE